MNKFLATLFLFSAIIGTAPTSVLALSFDQSSATIAVWKTKSGKWKACGPVQCLSLAEETESKAFEYVNGLYSSYQEIGKSGRCKVYQSLEKTKSFHHSAEWVLDKAKC
ncbi:hypothetical protein NBRC116590_32110 [Pelagimonas sp. KU-00592-HH]|uniref:hypothetical protein n=1 Tax=Pelagimonas sp. KU-00592-HH TaxID=3127651 RepID=UPI003109E992